MPGEEREVGGEKPLTERGGHPNHHQPIVDCVQSTTPEELSQKSIRGDGSTPKPLNRKKEPETTPKVLESHQKVQLTEGSFLNLTGLALPQQDPQNSPIMHPKNQKEGGTQTLLIQMHP